MTAAAIALISVSPPPDCWLAKPSRIAATTPPTAASVLHSAKTEMRIQSTLMPARRAASMLPPTAKILRPYAGASQQPVQDRPPPAP